MKEYMYYADMDFNIEFDAEVDTWQYDTMHLDASELRDYYIWDDVVVEELKNQVEKSINKSLSGHEETKDCKVELDFQEPGYDDDEGERFVFSISSDKELDPNKIKEIILPDLSKEMTYKDSWIESNWNNDRVRLECTYKLKSIEVGAYED